MFFLPLEPPLPSSSPLWFHQKTEGIFVKVQLNTHHKSQSWIFGSVHFPLAAPLHKPTKSIAITFLIPFSFSWTFSHPSPPPLHTTLNTQNNTHSHTNTRYTYIFSPNSSFALFCLSCPRELTCYFHFQEQKNQLPLVSMTFDVMCESDR